MPFLLLLIGALLFISAWQNTYGALAAQLGQDVPAFMKWGLAVGAVAASGYVPGMREVSRWLLALVLVVIVLKNYQAMLAGFTALSGAGAGSGDSPTPAEQASLGQLPTQAAIEGGATGTLVAGGAMAATGTGTGQAAAMPSLDFNPSQFLAPFSGFGFGGFG
jgi:hypothetical protein